MAADVDGPASAAADGRPVARLADKNYGNGTGKEGAGVGPTDKRGSFSCVSCLAERRKLR